jgi:hypothetical protein
METAASGSTAAGVRLSSAAAETLRALPKKVAAQVAEAIRRIGPDEGTPLKIPGDKSGYRYLAIEPSGRNSPVVIYRTLTRSEGDGYLVTAIVGRDEYDGYQRAERQGALDTPVGRALIGVAIGAAGYLAVRGARARARDAAQPVVTATDGTSATTPTGTPAA